MSHPAFEMHAPSFIAPHDDSEVFLSETFDIREVDSLELVSSDHHYDRNDGIRRDRYQFTMDDGTIYKASTLQPSKKAMDAVQNIANIETTAWTTNEYGMNERRQRRLARQGFATTIVSVPQNINYVGTLTNNAHSELAIHQTLAAMHGFNSNYFITIGVSRGAMTAFGAVDLAPFYNTEPVYSDHIVPCNPHGIDPETDLATYIDLPKNELSAIRSLGAVPLRALFHYRRTFDWKPLDMIRQLQEIPGLLSGATGKHAEQMPDDTFGYASVYEGDILSQGLRWKKLLADKSNFIVENIPGGGHASCVGEGSHTDWHERIQTVAEVIRNNPNVIKLGGTAVRNIAAEMNPVFRKGPLHTTPAA